MYEVFQALYFFDASVILAYLVNLIVYVLNVRQRQEKNPYSILCTNWSKHITRQFYDVISTSTRTL